MRLSTLQKFILTECYSRKGRVKKNILLGFYDKRRYDLCNSRDRISGIEQLLPSAKDQVDIITKSVESLIDKGLMVGYGVRTPKKWYIEEIRLMPKGRKIARRLLGEQQLLPFSK